MAIQVDNLKGETVIDPYNSKECFNKYLEKKVLRFSLENREIINSYIRDMLYGRNINGRKGKRGYSHLNTILSRMSRISSYVFKKYNKALVDITANELHEMFDDMREGKIQKVRGKGQYKSVHDYIKIFKAFWHWHMKVMRKESVNVEDITVDLSGVADHKPDFVYFTLDSLRKLMNIVKFEYKVLMIFMFDSGIRVTEMLNVKKKDISSIPNSNKLHLNIREETSKTFGRKIKLMLCADLLLQYINDRNIDDNEFVFRVNPKIVNRYLKRSSEKIFGKNLTKLHENTKSKSHITLYDFRHSSCCYWLPRYKSESALKYRFGWKGSSMIYYYSELLGMNDTINDDDMLVDTTKTQLENELANERKEREMLQDRMIAQEKDLSRMNKILQALTNERQIELDNKPNEK